MWTGKFFSSVTIVENFTTDSIEKLYIWFKLEVQSLVIENIPRFLASDVVEIIGALDLHWNQG